MKNSPSPKVIIPVSLLVLIGLGAVLKGSIPSSRVNKVILVSYLDQTCRRDGDCVIVSTRCSSCECGVPVNFSQKEKYQKSYSEACRDYHGAVCDFYCSTPYPRCIEQKCVLRAEAG